jgi:excisionase family DNA binding protein
MDVAPELLTPQEVAKLLKVRLVTVRSLTRGRTARPLPAIKVGKELRFLRSAIQNWISEGAQAGAR